MRVSVFSNSKNLDISAYYEGKEALELARNFAQNMSRVTLLTLETDHVREIYENGVLISTEKRIIMKDRMGNVSERR